MKNTNTKVKKVELSNTTINAIYIDNQNYNVENTVIIFVNGHNSYLGRIETMCQYFAKFAPLYAIDLPGFGHSTPYRGQNPGLIEYADTFAELINTDSDLKDKNIIWIGFSMGFSIIVEILRRNRDIESKSLKILGIGGFINKNALKFGRVNLFLSQFFSNIFAKKYFTAIAKFLVIESPIMRLISWFNYVKRYGHLTEEEKKQALDIKVKAWRLSDPYTHFYSLHKMLTYNPVEFYVNNQNLISVQSLLLYGHTDNYFNLAKVELYAKQYFANYRIDTMSIAQHSPSYVATVEDIKDIFEKSVANFLP